MPLKALFFDVFGTCVDWRKTVTEGLIEAAKESGDTTMVGP
jgi:2-haloacid dehalogenase